MKMRAEPTTAEPLTSVSGSRSRGSTTFAPSRSRRVLRYWTTVSRLTPPGAGTNVVGASGGTLAPWAIHFLISPSSVSPSTSPLSGIRSSSPSPSKRCTR
jgi:hypothetical protein